MVDRRLGEQWGKSERPLRQRWSEQVAEGWVVGDGRGGRGCKTEG